MGELKKSGEKLKISPGSLRESKANGKNLWFQLLKGPRNRDFAERNRESTVFSCMV